jgi:amidase
LAEGDILIGRLHCLALLDHFIARLDRTLNAIVVQDFDRARARARELDNTMATGQLHGLPDDGKGSIGH